jgi:hypothetical protein
LNVCWGPYFLFILPLSLPLYLCILWVLGSPSVLLSKFFYFKKYSSVCLLLKHQGLCAATHLKRYLLSNCSRSNPQRC